MIKNEIRPLTGIRGVAAIWVICFHFEPDITRLIPALSVLHPLFIRGGLGVDIFFVLSGFVMSTVYKIESFNLTLANHWNFIINRIARIYPNYIFFLTILVLMVAGDHLSGRNKTDPAEYPVASIGWHVIMMQAWPFISTIWSNWNAPAWSVSAEWFAYLLVFPACVWLISKTVIKRFGLVLALLLLTLFVFLGNAGKLHSFYFVCYITSEFVSGCMIYLFCLAHPRIVNVIAAYLDIIMLCFLAVAWFWLAPPINYWLIVLTIPLIIAGLTRESSLFARLLASPPLLFLGHVSYALYLVHAIAQRMLHMVVPTDRFAAAPVFERIVILAAYLLFPLLLATCCYYFVEEPSRLAIRRWSGGKPAMKPQPAVN